MKIKRVNNSIKNITIIIIATVRVFFFNLVLPFIGELPIFMNELINRCRRWISVKIGALLPEKLD